MGNYYKECSLIIKDREAVLGENLYLYKNDKNVELYFTIIDIPYNLNARNLLTEINVDYAKVKLMKDDGSVKKSFPIQPLVDNKVCLLITEELIDEDIELGTYSFQIRLYNSTQDSVITLPVVRSSVFILEPLFDDSEVTESLIAKVGSAKVGQSIVGGNDEETVVKEKGKSARSYSKKTWITGEVIDAKGLNNIEVGIQTNSEAIENKADIDHTHEEYVTEEKLNSKKYATETYVTNKIAEASLSGGEVDLSGYATKEELNTKADLEHIHEEYLTSIPKDFSDSMVAFFTNLPTLLSQLTYTTEEHSASVLIKNAQNIVTVLGGDVTEDDGDSESGTEEVVLISISVTYIGGDVTVGTNVEDLTGVTVIGNYSNGSTTTVIDYTLSGTIAEGTNTITVSYAGKTTTFTVLGIAESSGEGDNEVEESVEPIYQLDSTYNLTNGQLDTGFAPFSDKTPYDSAFTVCMAVTATRSSDSPSIFSYYPNATSNNRLGFSYDGWFWAIHWFGAKGRPIDSSGVNISGNTITDYKMILTKTANSNNLICYCLGADNTFTVTPTIVDYEGIKGTFTETLLLGEESGWANGSIDDFKYYNRAFSNDEINTYFGGEE